MCREVVLFVLWAPDLQGCAWKRIRKVMQKTRLIKDAGHMVGRILEASGNKKKG